MDTQYILFISSMTGITPDGSSCGSPWHEWAGLMTLPCALFLEELPQLYPDFAVASR